MAGGEAVFRGVSLGLLERSSPCGAGAVPVSVSPLVGVLGAVSWVTTVPGCFLTLLSVLKSFSSCSGLGR